MDLRGEKGIRIRYSRGNSSSILVWREERVTHTFGQTNVGNEEIHSVGVYSGLANNTQGSGEHAPTSLQSWATYENQIEHSDYARTKMRRVPT